MKQIILDTNFILVCVSQKIDFFEWLIGKYEIIIPIEVIREIKKIADPNKRTKVSGNAKISLKILEMNKNNFKTIKLGKYVDRGILEMALTDSGLVIATLDEGIKRKLKTSNKFLLIRGRKKLEVF